jgi:hypothetical protein
MAAGQHRCPEIRMDSSKSPPAATAQHPDKKNRKQKHYFFHFKSSLISVRSNFEIKLAIQTSLLVISISSRFLCRAYTGKILF